MCSPQSILYNLAVANPGLSVILARVCNLNVVIPSLVGAETLLGMVDVQRLPDMPRSVSTRQGVALCAHSPEDEQQYGNLRV